MESPDRPRNPDEKTEQFRRGVETVLDGLFSGLHHELIEDTGRVDDKRLSSWTIENESFYIVTTYADATSPVVTDVSLCRMEMVLEDLRKVRFYFYDPIKGVLQVSDDNPLTLEEALSMNGNLKRLNPTRSTHEAGVAHGVVRANDLFKLDFIDDLDSFPRSVED
jgi:hypothetical protein